MRIAIIGNCQVETMALVSSMMLENAEIRVFDYSHPYAHDEEARIRFAESLGDTDLILTQLAHFSHCNHVALRERYGSRVVTVANFYFRGLFPDSCYVGDFDHRLSRPMTVNSILVLDAFRRGLSEAEAVRAFAPENWQRLGLFEAWSSSMEEMHRREAGGAVDVPVADFMEDACRRYPAFLTMNHPSAPLMTEYMRTVFEHVGLPVRFINVLRVPDPLAKHDTTPILDEVAEFMKLPYRTSQLWKVNSMGRRFISRDDYVAEFYHSYRETDPASLVVNSPTDLVERLRATPELAYLVDPALPTPVIEKSPEEEPASTGVNPAALRRDIARAIDPIGEKLEEVRVYTHRVHSFVETMDPKVERLVHELPKLVAAAEAVARSDLATFRRRDRLLPRVGRRLRSLMTAMVVAVSLGLAINTVLKFVGLLG